MPEFALLADGQLKEVRVLDERPAHIPHKGFEWYPVERRVGDEAFKRVEDDTFIIQTVPPPEPEPVFQDTVSPRQARLALAQLGLLEAANAAVAQADEATQIAWEYSTEVKFNDPGVIAMASIIGINDEQRRDLFILAASFQ